MGGVFFEIIAQRRFQEGGVESKFIPMVRLPSNRRQWKTSHIPLSDKKLEDLRQDALQQEELLIIPSSFPVYVFKGDGPSSIESNIIYVPEKDNQVAFDSFILMNGFLYLFQFSISKCHSIKGSSTSSVHMLCKFHLWMSGISHLSIHPTTCWHPHSYRVRWKSYTCTLQRLISSVRKPLNVFVFVVNSSQIPYNISRIPRE